MFLCICKSLIAQSIRKIQLQAHQRLKDNKAVKYIKFLSQENSQEFFTQYKC